MKKIKILSHRQFIYLNKDTPSFNEMMSYLITIWKNQYTKNRKKIKKLFILKNIKLFFKKIYRRTLSYTSQFSKKSIKKKERFFFLTPQPKFSSYNELKNSLINTENISGYWGEHIIKKELQSQGFQINNSCKFENKYGDLDIIAYKQGKNGRINTIEFHEIKTLTKGSTKENINLLIESQMRHLLSQQQRKGGKKYVEEILSEQVNLGNFSAQKLLNNMKKGEVKYFLHKIVIDNKGKEIVSKRQKIFWKPVHKQSIIWNYFKNIF